MINWNRAGGIMWLGLAVAMPMSFPEGVPSIAYALAAGCCGLLLLLED